MSRHRSRISRLERGYTQHARAHVKTKAEIPEEPVAFARQLDIEPDPWQRDLLTSTDEHVILNCSRQSGKSTSVAILALHHALRNPGALILILSPSQRQSGELLRKIIDLYHKLGRPGNRRRDSATALEFNNGSRIVALPGSEFTIRGFSVPALILIDEAARVSEELYHSVRPMLAVSRGRLILLSTPRGKQGIFWHAWEHEPNWTKVKVTADQCPRISPEFLEQERRIIGDWRFAQEFLCEFRQDNDAVFKEGWIRYYDPERIPPMDTIIQSWDTALTKSATSDFVVGQVWGRKGADFYLLDQVRGRFDFDKTVQEITDLSTKWPDSTAKLIEAQMLGPALATHLKHQVAGIIPITAKGPKELRAQNCVPVWQSGNVYLPTPDGGKYEWVSDYVQELIGFPNAEHDDQVDATTQALNQMRRTLFPESKQCVVPAVEARPLPDRYYRIAWIPARQDNESTLLVYDATTNAVVHFERIPAEPSEGQITQVFQASVKFNNASVRAVDDYDDALLRALEHKGVYLRRVKFNQKELAAAYENLGMLIHKRMISYPYIPELIAELDVFKSDFTYSGAPEYGLQIAQQSGINALCLVTFEVDPEEVHNPYENVWYHYVPEQLYDQSKMFGTPPLKAFRSARRGYCKRGAYASFSSRRA
jgi:predicted phage terminase large subunit-like protein